VDQPSADRFHNKLADFHNKSVFVVKLLSNLFTKIREAFTKNRLPLDNDETFIVARAEYPV